MTVSGVVDIRGLVKDYHGLRPLRVRSLTLQAGERVAIAGLDATAAEVFLNIVNGAILPDAGEVRVFGTLTSELRSESEWLASLDRFGIVSARAVLLEGSTMRQNLALPYSLEIDDLPAAVDAQVRAIAAEVGIGADWLPRRVAEAPPDVRMRAHLARALAVRPAVLLMEHPTAALPRDTVPAFARDVREVVERRAVAVLAITEDTPFADAVADRAYRLQGGTGVLANARGWRRFF